MTPHDTTLRLFPDTETAYFTRRLNRFALECRVRGSKATAHLPNPGRLRELLLPGRTLYLTKHGNTAPGRLPYTAVAVEREGAPVLLHTHRANAVVRWLIEKGSVPEYEGARIVKAEATVGRSRFDFLLEKDGGPFLLEVKSCTLFEGEIAMFPDAVTARGARHLAELADEAERGIPGGVIFLVHSPRAQWFLPDYHTDLAFAKMLLNVRHSISVTPLAVSWNRHLTMDGTPRFLAIPWHLIEDEARDRGSYILILSLSRGTSLSAGALGERHYPKGYYLYIGSAMKNLTGRINRHLRRRKAFFWHIDYLRDRADICTALAVRSSARLECELAAAVSSIAQWHIPGFGASDCRCASHLFGMKANPLADERFIGILQHYRMERLMDLLK